VAYLFVEPIVYYTMYNASNIIAILSMNSLHFTY